MKRQNREDYSTQNVSTKELRLNKHFSYSDISSDGIKH